MASQDENKSKGEGIVALAKAINHLGLNLYQELAKEQKNVFISPLSLSTALSMLFCGASGTTSSEMNQVLGLEVSKISKDEVGSCYELLMSVIEKGSNSYTLSNANVVFSQKEFHVKDAFKILLSQSFHAAIVEVDFKNKSKKAVQKANEWIKDKTKGMIPKLIDKLDKDTVMVLLNAVYFKGFWMHRFDKQATFEQTFYNKGMESSKKMVKMMSQKKPFPFVDKETHKALQLSYEGDEIAMLVILPSDRKGLGDLERKLSSDFIMELKSQMREQDVYVALPKFRLEYSKSVKNDLKSLGMNSAFRRGANLSGISDSRDLFVSDVVHKAVIEVNEEGSEAAAATAVQIMATCVEIFPEFVVDRPFIFLIYNTKTDLILFIGRIIEL